MEEPNLVLELFAVEDMADARKQAAFRSNSENLD